MGVVPPIRVFANGPPAVAAADLNTGLGDPLRFIYSPPRLHTYLYSAGVMASATWYSVNFGADAGAGYDTDNMHSAGSSRITCNTAGVFEGQANVQHAGVAEAHTVLAALCLNNGGISNARPPGTAGQLVGQLDKWVPAPQPSAVTLSIQFKIRLNVGDYLELGFWQNAGRTLALNTGYWETYVQCSMSEA